MKTKLMVGSLLASAMFAGLGIAPAMAQNTNTPVIDRAQQEISARIQQGFASGNISPGEAQALNQREREIQIRENRYKADGDASPQERQQLRQDLDGLRAEVEQMIARPPRPMPQQGTNTPGIDERAFKIQDRIDEGVRSGQISQREARALNRTERDIERHEARFKADGVVTAGERRQLRRELMALRDKVEDLMERQPQDRYSR